MDGQIHLENECMDDDEMEIEIIFEQIFTLMLKPCGKQLHG